MICEWDWWLGTDYCEAGRILQNTFSDNPTKIYFKDVLQISWLYLITLGPDTTNFEWGPWGEFGECEGKCGEMGERIRHRTCIPPTNGGYPCPAEVDSESEVCEMAPCQGK